MATAFSACLADIKSWMCTNLLKLNQDKTELMLFCPKHKTKDVSTFNLEFGEASISDSSFVKNVGVFFDRTLSMDKNCSTIVRTCFNNIRKIGRIRPYITDEACKTLINSLVTSRLDYGNSLMYGINKHLLNKLQKVQNTAARLITRTKKFDHVTPILKDLHWLPVEYRSQYKLLLFVYKALNNCAPNYLSDLFKIYSPSRSLRSQNSFLLDVPKIRTVKYGSRRFDYAAASLWNSLPLCLKHSRSVSAFKIGLKTHLFGLAYDRI